MAEGDWDKNKGWADTDHDRKAQWLELKVQNKIFYIINTHLTHLPEGKNDSEKRIRQSERLSELLHTFSSPKILAGDFNLLPETKSIRMIEKANMRNLVTEYKVPSTRTELYRKFIGGPKFADYIFSSPEVQVKDFRVLPDVVSDHSPLLVDFNL